MSVISTVNYLFLARSVIIGCWLGCVWFSDVSAQPSARQRDKTHRLAPWLRSGKVQNSRQALRVQVTDTAAFAGWMKQHLPACRLTKTTSKTVFSVTVNDQRHLTQLLDCPLVTFIDVSNRIAREERDLEGYDLSLNRITDVQSRYPALTGQGLAVSVKEKPFDTTDIDFKGRVVNTSFSSAEPSTTHATTMASLIAGGGNNSVFSRGVAWQARLASASFAELLPDEDQLLFTAGISVQNHSYGVGIENYYGIEALEYDKQCLRNPTLVHVFSSGNAGNQASTDGIYKDLTGFANLTGQFKLSKNTLSVGAIDITTQLWALSSRGPAYDGRLKPELVAYGDGGTSESAALVSGICLLVQQAYQERNNGTLPPASLVKAILMNSAEDIGRSGPDFETGYGNANATEAVKTVLENRFTIGEISQSAEKTIQITVPAGVRRLKVTLVWHDVEATPNAATALVHDLDMELRHPATDKRWKPWVLNAFPHPDSLVLPAQRQADHLNNTEQVTLDQPEAGTYEIRVKGYAVAAEKQAFSLAYEWENDAFSWLSPVENSLFRTGQANSIRWKGKTLPASGRLEYRFVGQSDWQLIATTDSLSASVFQWTPPDTNARAQIRLVAGNQHYISDTVTVFRPLTIQVGYQCPTETMLFWSPVAGVGQYQVFRLKDAYLEPFVQTTDTLLVLDETQKQVQHYAVAPVFRGSSVAARSLTVNYTQQGTGCYFRSFLARKAVTDTVWLDAEISTTYQLQSATLERETNGRFEPVQAQAPLPNVQLSFQDSSPLPGRNVYRLRLRTTQNTDIYSDSEAVFYLRRNELLLYPNPVVAGADLNLAASESGAATIQVLDTQGRLILETSDSGSIKTLSTASLAQGIYIVRIQTQRGTVVSQKLVVL